MTPHSPSAAPSASSKKIGALASPPPPLTAPEPILARQLGRLARRTVWRVLHPAARESFRPQERLRALDRLVYHSSDGWRAPLLWLPPVPGGSGEPVVLAHALGLSPDAFRIDLQHSLAGALRRAGFSVYLLAHRGDRAAEPPLRGGAFSFDDVLERDLPAALARVREHSGFPQVHWVGHGLGGQLGLAWAGRDRLASVTALCAPVSFAASEQRTELRRMARIAAVLPCHWSLPTGSLAWAVAPWVGDGSALAGACSASTGGEQARGMLCQGSQDLGVGLIRQIGRWIDSGCWTDATGLLDYAASLADARDPLLVLAAQNDALCPPRRALEAAERWGGSPTSSRVLSGYAHLDPLTACDADAQVFQPIVRFLSAHRRRAWAGHDPFAI